MKPAKTSLLFALLLGLLPAAYAEDYDDEAYQNLITQCTRNQLDSCVTLGIWTRDYLESPTDAYLPLKKACDGKNMKGCNVLANLYLDPYSGLGMDYPKALELYRKACKGGYENACRNAKETEEEMRNQTAEDRTAKRQERLEALQRSCMGENDAACRALQRELQR